MPPRSAPWNGTITLDVQQFHDGRVRIACALPDIFGTGPLALEPVLLDADEADALGQLCQKALNLVETAAARAAPSQPLEEDEPPAPLYTDPTALSPRHRKDKP